MKNQKKNMQKGITLIALVVTIVVLIILATVSILAVFGDNGIIARAEKAKSINDEETKKEEIKFAVIGSYNDNGKLDRNLLKDNLNKITWLKQTTKIENDAEKEIGEQVDVLPFIIFTNDDKAVYVNKDGDVTIKEKPSRDIDINSDGIIDYVDCEMVNMCASGKSQLTDEQRKKADVDNDGEITMSDVYRILLYVNGKAE